MISLRSRADSESISSVDQVGSMSSLIALSLDGESMLMVLNELKKGNIVSIL